MSCSTQVSSQQLGPSSSTEPDLSRSTFLLQNWLGDDAAKRHRREIHFPTGRFGEAIEQAQAVLFLASDESSFVNGTDFVVDGAMTKVDRDYLDNEELIDNLHRHTLHPKVRRRSLPSIRDSKCSLPIYGN